jgi:peptide chain release factor 1
MHPLLLKKMLSQLVQLSELEHTLSDAQLGITERAHLAQQHHRLTLLSAHYQQYCAYQKQLLELSTLQNDSDPDMVHLATLEYDELTLQNNTIVHAMQDMLLPVEPYDHASVFIEIRAAAGGAESALFVADLAHMYYQFSILQHWSWHRLYGSDGDYGGYKTIVFNIEGRQAYKWLKLESGVHRIQRVPATEAQGRVHTSTCTVAVFPDTPHVANATLNTNDLRIDTFRASGAGGQHVNKTNSAIRITHLPTGLVVECQDDRSQHRNKAKAMTLLEAKLQQQQQQQQHQKKAQQRRQLIGTGDRSERIRTYNVPQNRLTDHRIDFHHALQPLLQDGYLWPMLNALHNTLLSERIANFLETPT